MPKKWEILKTNKKIATKIKNKLKVPKLIARTIANRGINTPSKAKQYIEPNILNLYSPFIFRDMEKAVERIYKAVENKKGILIFGDRDVDGVTSTAILYKVLQKMGARIAYHVPEGEEDYGISKDVIARTVNEGFDLIITVDCGITAIDEIDYANSLGLDVIITDHHEPREVLPKAHSIINPKIKEDNYPFEHLSGAGVVLKLIQGIAEKSDLESYYNEEIVFFDIETTGLDPYHSEITEIGAVIMKNGVEIDKYQVLIKVESKLSQEIINITGITDEMLAEKGIDPKTAIQGFIDFIGDRKLVGHNLVDFDIKFIKNYAKKYLDKPINNPVEDTLKMSRSILKKISKHNLGATAEHLGIEFDPNILHRAIIDSEICAESYRRMLIGRSVKLNDLYKEYLPLAALGTVADIMSLVDENRNIVKNGLKLIPHTSVGLLSLMRMNSLNIETITARTVSWNIAPLLNAPGRVGEATLSVELLISNKLKEGDNLAKQIIEKNNERKEIFETIRTKVGKNIDKSLVEQEKLVFYSSDKILRGVTGLLANRLTKAFQTPAMILSIEGDEANGSVRATGEFNVIRMLENLSDVLLQFGGHTYAGGFTIKTENIELLHKKASEYIKDFDAKKFEESITIDAVLDNFDDLTMTNFKYIENILEPTGQGNKSPVYLIENITIEKAWMMGKNNEHINITAKKVDKNFKVLAWNHTAIIKDLQQKYTYFDIVGSPEINRYQGKEEARLVLIDIRGRK